MSAVEDPKTALSEADQRSIAAFQAVKADFQPRWNRNLIQLFLPAFVLFALGGGLLELLHSGQAGKPNWWLLVPAQALCLAGFVRAWRLMWRHLRCPACGRVQKPAWQVPYRRCTQCQARLSVGWRDSR